MSIGLIVTGGFGTGVLSGAIKDVVTFGYSIGVAIVTNPETFSVNGLITNSFSVNGLISDNFGTNGIITNTYSVDSQI